MEKERYERAKEIEALIAVADAYLEALQNSRDNIGNVDVSDLEELMGEGYSIKYLNGQLNDITERKTELETELEALFR